MGSLCGKTFRILLLGALVALFSTPAAAQADAGRFLVISDIHFDPFHDGALFDRLDTHPVEDWPAILETSQPPGFNRRGTDSNYALLTSSLDDVRQRVPDPDFILYPGDFLAHQWQSRYDRLARQSHLADPEAYRAFTSKTIRFLADEFRRRYPTTPILPTLGNDDSFCGDYLITPDGPFLAMFAEVWAPLLGPDVDRQAFRATFSRGGHYTVTLPRMINHRLVVLNSVFFSVSYDNACGTSTQTPALDQLRWLAETLEHAHQAGEAVWLLMHIPPGINSFSTSESVSRGGPAITFWQPELTSRFLRLVERYRATIQVAFAGHTHMDDFRVIRRDGQPVLLTKIAPAISPIFGNNPGYQVFQHDRETGTLRNYQTYYLTNLATDGEPTALADGRWALEYDFRQTYDVPALTPRTVAHLADRIRTDDAVQRHYATYYSVSADPEISDQTLDVYRCAIQNVTPAEFQRCYRGVPTPASPPAPPSRRVTTPGQGSTARPRRRRRRSRLAEVE